MVDKRNVYFVVSTIFLGFLSGCGKEYSYSYKSFDPQDIDRIVILPFMDDRQDADPEHDLAEMTTRANDSMNCELRFKKKYRTAFSSDIGNVSSYSTQDLPFLDLRTNSFEPGTVDTEWVKQLGPPTSQWVFVPVLKELSRRDQLILKKGTAKIWGYLFNKKTGECCLITRGAYVITAGFGQDALAEVSSVAIAMAAMRCVSFFPERPGPYLLPD